MPSTLNLDALLKQIGKFSALDEFSTSAAVDFLNLGAGWQWPAGPWSICSVKISSPQLLAFTSVCQSKPNPAVIGGETPFFVFIDPITRGHDYNGFLEFCTSTCYKLSPAARTQHGHPIS